MSGNGDRRVKEKATDGRSSFYRLGAFAHRRRWWIVIAWVLVMFAAVPFLGKLGTRLSSGGFAVPGSQSDKVGTALENDFTSQFVITDLLVLHSDTLTIDQPDYQRVILALRSALQGKPGVAVVSDPNATPQQSISPDRHTATITIGLTDNQDQALRNSPILEEAVAQTAKGTAVDATLTGPAPFYRAFQDTTTHDLERAEKIALPISLLILILAFGSLVAAGMPLILALVALGITMGIVSAIAAATTMSIFAQNIASMIGIGVGIDYTLFVLNRYRDELRAGRSVEEAVGWAMATSGKAVLVSALTVVVALSGVLLVNIAAFRSMGIAAMVSVAVAGAAAMTLLPALLSIVGRGIDKVSIRRRSVQEGRLWHRWAMGVMRRPWLALIASLLVIGFIALPTRHLRLGSSGPSILPAGAGPRVALETVADAFGEGQGSPVKVVLHDGQGILQDGFADVYAVAKRAAADPEVVRVDSMAGLVPGATLEEARNFANSPLAAEAAKALVSGDGQSSLVLIVTRHGAQSDEVHAYVDRIRADLVANLDPGVTGLVGGDPGLESDLNHELGKKIVPVFGLVLVLSFLVLMVFFRSLLLPLKAVLMNLASVLGAYGLMVYVFQEGHFEHLLGFTAAGHIESFLPLFLFCILFGLSMDYEVFLLARIREEYLKTGDNTEAVGWGLEHTARIITSAAAIMVTVFGAFAFARLVPIKAMGFGLAVAVLLDATLIRVILVPATMRLMGKWNWWLPKWLDRIIPEVSLEGAPTPTETPRMETPVPS